MDNKIDITPNQIAYACLWRYKSNDKKLDEARCVIMNLIGGIYSVGQHQAIQWAKDNLPPAVEGEKVALDSGKRIQKMRDKAKKINWEKPIRTVVGHRPVTFYYQYAEDGIFLISYDDNNRLSLYDIGDTHTYKEKNLIENIPEKLKNTKAYLNIYPKKYSHGIGKTINKSRKEMLWSRIDDKCLGGIKITVFDNGEFKVKKIK